MAGIVSAGLLVDYLATNTLSVAAPAIMPELGILAVMALMTIGRERNVSIPDQSTIAVQVYE